jgi:hypothetical protein
MKTQFLFLFLLSLLSIDDVSASCEPRNRFSFEAHNLELVKLGPVVQHKSATGALYVQQLTLKNVSQREIKLATHYFAQIDRNVVAPPDLTGASREKNGQHAVFPAVPASYAAPDAVISVSAHATINLGFVVFVGSVLNVGSFGCIEVREWSQSQNLLFRLDQRLN